MLAIIGESLNISLCSALLAAAGVVVHQSSPYRTSSEIRINTVRWAKIKSRKRRPKRLICVCVWVCVRERQRQADR